MVAVVVMLVASCRDSTAPELMSGVYALVRYDGHALPYDLGPMPTKGGTQSACSLLLAEGRLEIFADRGTWYLSYDYRNSCTQEFMSQVGLQGQYVAEGNSLDYRITRSDGLVIAHHGRLTASTISFETDDEVLLFAR